MNNILFEENSFFDINKIYNNNPVKCKMCGKEITLKKYSAYIVENESITIDLLNKATETFL